MVSLAFGHCEVSMGETILQVEELKKYFQIRHGAFQRVIGVLRAIDGVSFKLGRNETLGLAGESGSGKTTLGMTLLGVYHRTAGSITYKGMRIEDMTRGQRRGLIREIQAVFQDPGSSLNPRRTIWKTVELPLLLHTDLGRKARARRVAELLSMVGLPPEYMIRYPYALSGGQRQRVAIARALALHPSVVILDEPTSALDVSVQGKVLTLLTRLGEEMELSYLLISHDLSMMSNVASRVAILYLGKIVELSAVDGVFDHPLHPYTRMLLSAIPVVSAAEEDRKPARVACRGEIPSARRVPPGCSFHPRCPRAVETCTKSIPPLEEQEPGHFVACHLLGQ